MGRELIKVLVMFILAGAVSGCAKPLLVGSGQKFTQAVNPEPDRMSLVYFFRKDGALSKGLVDFPPYLVTKYTPLSVEKFPVIILGDRMYRPMLFEPGEMTFSVITGGSETIILKSGETRCIEASRSFRGIVFIGVSELPLRQMPPGNGRPGAGHDNHPAPQAQRLNATFAAGIQRPGTGARQ